VKPFKGKPEKPERSKGEIQRVSEEAPDGRATDDSRVVCAFRPCCDPSPNACTSPPVGRRDPLGAGLRPAVESVRTLRRFRANPRCFPGRLARRYTDGAGPLLSVSVRPSASAPVVMVIGPGAGPVPGWLLAVVFSDRPRLETPICDAIALGTFRTRLVTRSKESSMCASHWDITKPKGVMKVKVRLART